MKTMKTKPTHLINCSYRTVFSTPKKLNLVFQRMFHYVFQ